MAEVNIYKVRGFYKKNKQKIPLTMEIRATKISEVLEKVYAEVGSRHGANRNEIFIPKDGGIEIISNLEEVRRPEFQDLDADDFSIPRKVQEN